MKRSLILYLFMATTIISAQNPGGVVGSKYWLKPSKDSNDCYEINHNLVYSQAMAEIFTFDNDLVSSLKGLTLFCVFMSDSTIEQALLSYRADSLSHTIVSNKRTADLARFQYINYDKTSLSAPRLITFVSKIGTNNDKSNQQIFFGDSIRVNGLPMQGFRGLTAELAAYATVLNYNDRQKIESYLALKYGISLSQAIPYSYIDSKGRIVWDAVDNSLFSSSIAGLGRDDASEFIQHISGSMECPGLLEIERKNLSDGEYLVWSDNNKRLEFSRNYGQPTVLQRVWRISVHGEKKSEKSSLYFDANQLREIKPLEQSEVYWLAVDRNASGQFMGEHTVYYSNNSGNNEKLRFDDIVWDTDDSGTDQFTIMAAPTLFATIEKEAPSCRNNKVGNATIRIVGGEPPYEVRLVDHAGKTADRKFTENQLCHFSSLQQGIYGVLVSDRRKNTYKTEFLLANSDMDHIPEFEVFRVRQSKVLFLNAFELTSSPSGFVFIWQLPSGNTIRQPEIAVTTPGIYRLTIINDQGCTTMREIEVLSEVAGCFQDLELSPNPTKDGWTKLKIRLSKRGKIRVIISDLAGRILHSHFLQDEDYYSVDYFLPQVGVWLMTVEGEGDQKSFKIIRK